MSYYEEIIRNRIIGLTDDLEATLLIRRLRDEGYDIRVTPSLGNGSIRNGIVIEIF